MDKKTKELVFRYLNLVDVVLAKMFFIEKPSFTREDAHSVGKIALIEACKRFDPAKGGAEVSYFMQCIRGSIIDEMRRQDPLPRSVRRAVKDIEEARHELEQIYKREPSNAEIAKYLGKSLGYILKINKYQNRLYPFQIDDPENTIFHNTHYDPTEKLPTEALFDSEANQLVNAALSLLTNEKSSALKLKYFYGFSQKEIAEQQGVSHQAVGHRCCRGIRELRAHLNSVI